jgi:hypothetical protein
VREGMDLKEALASISANRDSFGNLGGMTAELSDGSHLEVENQKCADGHSYLMSSQRIERRNHDTYTSTDKLVRVYPW